MPTPSSKPHAQVIDRCKPDTRGWLCARRTCTLPLDWELEGRKQNRPRNFQLSVPRMVPLRVRVWASRGRRQASAHAASARHAR